MKYKNTSFNNLLLLLLVSLLICSCKEKPSNSKTMQNDTKITEIDFWNGNRSSIRQAYELEVLKAVLEATSDEFGKAKINESLVEYPGKEESLAFTEKKHDLFVTVAGNQKFKNEDQLIVHFPIAKNLLGYRIPILRKENSNVFKSLSTTEIQQLKHGIPATWSDATILRHNNFEVVENGSFEDLFDRLSNKEFDYTTFGANEVASVYKKRVSKQNNLFVDSNLVLFYPFPLVFYVHPNQPKLAQRIEIGLKLISESGELDQLFESFFSTTLHELKLKDRKLIVLENPLIPENFSTIHPILIHD